ncbi:hypothetical protein SteCoe_7506 [Stentor coeruleus]|uniref:Uncharacterized protein n=1 Tax=Stentor coeruleus TaxID=5963 RepID=A0A1R2CMH2_9CILI|nr:hypothetical protein SteCoe_7506 [Stentor coeruleus]
MQVRSSQKILFSSQRDSFLSPKTVDPITLPKYIRAQVCKTEQPAKSPVRKGIGQFNCFNQTTEERMFKYTKKRINQIQRTDSTPKAKKQFSHPKTDTVVLPQSQKVLNMKNYTTFKPSDELKKYNENRSKMQRKGSASPSGKVKSARETFDRSQSPLAIEEVLKLPFDLPERLTKKPGEISFYTLKKAVKGFYKSSLVY